MLGLFSGLKDLGGAAGVDVLAHAGLVLRLEGGHGRRKPGDVVVGGQGDALGVGEADDLLHGGEHGVPLRGRDGQPAVGQPEGRRRLVEPDVDHQLVPLAVEDVGTQLVGNAAGGQVPGHRLGAGGDGAVPLAELDAAGRLEHQVAAGAVGVHPDGDAPQNMAGVGGVEPLFAGDAVEDAEDDGVGPHKGRDVPDGVVEGGGFDRHQNQIDRPAVGGVAQVKAAHLAVAGGGVGGIARRPLAPGDDLHPRHLPPKQDAQSPQPDQRRGTYRKPLRHAACLLAKFR